MTADALFTFVPTLKKDNAFSQIGQKANLRHFVNTNKTENKIPATQQTPLDFRFLTSVASTCHIHWYMPSREKETPFKIKAFSKLNLFFYVQCNYSVINYILS